MAERVDYHFTELGG
jgi:hypothetical protein